MNNEQPLQCDLRALPAAVDACLVCTNLRYLNGKKPSFTDSIDSWFLIPLGIVRFVEVPQSAIAEAEETDSVLALPSGLSGAEVASDELRQEAALLQRMREM
jgi:hypothetical protein